jgi:tetratricopeptide (TPR) repeat protein
MAKTGRNDPCPCGSGQKYKRCCLVKDEAAAAAARPPPPVAAPARHTSALLEAFRAGIDPYDNLDADSNAVVGLIHDGKLDEAERAARDLLVHYPDVIDGHDRLGMVFEARGDKKQAAHHYRQAADFIVNNPEGFEEASLAYFRERIAELDPTSA